MKKVNVIGLGYIGLPIASLLAMRGYSVLGIDISEDVVHIINAGGIHIVEPDLDLVVRSVVETKSLRASTMFEPADIHIIAVPTPFKEDYKPDLTYVESAAEALCVVLKAGDLVILESTSPVGTTEKLASIISEIRSDIASLVYVAHSPERVLPGKILRELIENDRVIGGVTKEATDEAVRFYKTFVKGSVYSTDSRTAEMCKLAENAFRDLNIAYANELSLICDQLKINVWELIRLANHHPRVNILQPSAGVGGHCIAVDPWFIVDAAPQQAKLIRQAREVNDYKPVWILELIEKSAKSFERPVIALLGAAFKPDVDDFRESPALFIIETLRKKNIGELLVVEPFARKLDDFVLIDIEQALEKANIIVILVKHTQFLEIIDKDFSDKIVIDPVGLCKSKYHSILNLTVLG